MTSVDLRKHDLSEAQADRQWLDAWAKIAAGCEAGLNELHPQHPRRGELLRIAVDARLAAELPPKFRRDAS